MSTPCEMDLVCRNGDFMLDKQAKCSLCRLSPENIGRNMAHYWVPTKAAKKDYPKHPQLEEEKRHVKLTKRINKLQKNQSRDKAKRKISRLAQQAEKTTEKQIIRATKNSGRSNKDGDHVLYKSITLDTKLQTTRTNPIVKLSELEKVRRDADRASTIAGGLLIRNKNGVGVVVFYEADVPNILLLKEE